MTTGFYHMGARFYDPTIGRWLSEDPVQDQRFNPSSLNFYAYAWNSPLAFVDQDGLFAIPSQLFTGISVHAAVARWFRDTFPGSFTELRIQGFGMRLDMMKPGPSGAWEVYELKPRSVFDNPKALGKAQKQLQGYVHGLRARTDGMHRPAARGIHRDKSFRGITFSMLSSPVTRRPQGS